MRSRSDPGTAYGRNRVLCGPEISVTKEALEPRRSLLAAPKNRIIDRPIRASRFARAPAIAAIRPQRQRPHPGYADLLR